MIECVVVSESFQRWYKEFLHSHKSFLWPLKRVMCGCFMHTIEGGKNFNSLHQSLQCCHWKCIECIPFVFDNWWFSFQGQRWQWHWNFFLSYMAYSMLALHYLIYFTFLGQRICEETTLGMLNNSFLKSYKWYFYECQILLVV